MTVIQTQKRLVQYLTYKSESRGPLRALMKDISDELQDASIFGGMVRDFGLGFARSFRSDIDIVTMSPSSDVFDLIKKFDPVRNRFGGYRFSAAGHLFDIWSFFDTWAIREGLIEGHSLEDLCKTTFFSLDAALFRLRDRRVIAANDYDNRLKSRVLEVNLKRHPYPRKVAKRAVRMAMTKKLLLSPYLCDFVLCNVKRADCDESHFLRSLRDHVASSPEKSFDYTTVGRATSRGVNENLEHSV